jgi:signal transduction histidine kinase
MIEAITDGVVTEPETIVRYHRTMRGEVRHLTALIDDLFELARLEALPAGAAAVKREVVALEDVISDTLEAMQGQAHAHAIHLTGEIEGELPPIALDARQIHRVLTNLVQNALGHTRAGGHVAIRATYLVAQPYAGARRIVVRVVDDGDGIVDADLPHIFEPTFRGERSRRRDGADAQACGMPGAGAATGGGLGLTIARGLVEAHGGTITAESPLSPAAAALLSTGGAEGAVLGPGACITVSLPI